MALAEAGIPTGDGRRLLVVSPGFPPQVGGIEAVVGRQTREMAARGYAVEVATQTRPGQPVKPGQASSGPVTVRFFANRLPGKQFQAAPGLWRYVRRSRAQFDLVHAHGFHATPALAAALATDQPLVFTPHYHRVGHTAVARAAHLLYDRPARLIFQRASAVVCVSEVEAALVRNDYPDSADRVTVIPNGVDADLLAAAEPYPNQGSIVLMAGRIERYKQYDRAIRAMAHANTDTILLISGAGPARAELEELVGRLGLHDRIRFLGTVPTEDLRRWMATATAVMTLSRHEAFGLVLLEGVAAGARVIASDVPAHREVAGLAGANVTFVASDVSPEKLGHQLASAVAAGRPAPPRLDRVPTWSSTADDLARTYASVIEPRRPH